MNLGPPDYEAGGFREGRAAVKSDNGCWGYIDLDGNEVIECIYDDAFIFEHGLGMVYRDGYYGFVDCDGFEVIECIYDFAEMGDDSIYVEKDGESYTIDFDGNRIEDDYED